MSRSLSDDGWSDLLERAAEAEAEHRRRFPEDAATSQPLHTLYVPADRVTPTTTVGFGTEALRLLETHAPDPAAFEEAFGVDPRVAERARTRVHAKLERQPVEDLGSTSRTGTAPGPTTRRTGTRRRRLEPSTRPASPEPPRCRSACA